MAIIATLNSNSFGVGGKYGLRVTVDLISQSIPNNTSTIVVRMYTTSTQSNGAYNLSDNNSVSLSVNRSTAISSSRVDLDFRSANSPCLIGTSSSITITHDADGSKTIPISGSIYFNSSASSSLPKGTYYFQEKNVTLTTIPRASTLSFNKSSVAVGGSITTTITRASSSFTHTLTYSFKGEASSAATSTVSSVATSHTFEIPYNDSTGWQLKMPTTKSGTCTVTCTTYNGTTAIGTSTATFTVTAPSTVSISSVSAKAQSLPWNNSGAALLIKGISTAVVSFTCSASSGATLKSAVVSYSGGSKSYSFPANTASGTGSVSIPEATVGTFSVVATDSRGYSSSASSVTIPVRDYTAPTINVSFDESNVTDTTRTLITIVTGTATPRILEEDNTTYYANTVTLKWRGHVYPNGTWTSQVTASASFSGSATNYRNTFTTNNLSVSRSVEVEVIALDTITGSAGQKTVLARAPVRKPAYGWDNSVFNFNTNVTFDNGDQMADRKITFANTAEDDDDTYHHDTSIYGGSPESRTSFGVEDNTALDGDTHFYPIVYEDRGKNLLLYARTGQNARSFLADFPIEVKYDTTTGLNYRKWFSGVAEVWGDKTVTPGSQSQTGQLYYAPQSGSSFSYNLPITFATASPVISCYGSYMWPVNVRVSGSVVYYNLMRGISIDSNTITIHIYIIGKVQGAIDRVYDGPLPSAAAVAVTTTINPDGGIVKHITAVDLSNDTVDAAHLVSGYTAHDAEGNAITGTHAP